MKKTIFFIFLPLMIFGQQVGSWKQYFSFNNVFDLAESNNGKFFVASENGFFTYQNNEITDIFTKTDYLSDINISAIAYCVDNQKIICGYKNGNIDIITNSGTVNLPYIKDKPISIDKGINHITAQNTAAYLATNFGIVKLNLNINEIEETYSLSENENNAVYDVYFYEDSIYAATQNGLFSIALNANPINFSNWHKIAENQVPICFKIKFFNKNIVVLTQENNTLKIKIRKNNIWQSLYEDNNIRDFDADDNKLVVALNDRLVVFDTYLTQNQEIIPSFANKNFNKVFISKNGKIFIGDKNNGLINVENNTAIYPNAPLSNSIFRLNFTNGILYCTNGGFLQDYSKMNNDAQIYFLKDNQWQNIILSGYKDPTDIAIDKSDAQHWFIGTWGDGLLEVKDFEIINVFNTSNSTLIYSDGSKIKINKLFVDNQNTLWIAQNGSVPLHNYNYATENWTKFDFNNSYNNRYTITELKTLSDGTMLILFDFRGFNFFDYNQTSEETSDDTYFIFYPKDDNGELIGTHLNSFSQDKNGNIWFGGTDGIGVITEYDKETNEAVASRILIETQDQDTSILNYLLKGTYITKIITDAANRKWIGTNNGLYLVNEFGTEQIYHFTKDNSPLPSDFIYDLALNPATGELFIATSQGLVSYFTDAAQGNNSFDNAYVYPNPVEHSYQGNIVIKGLLNNTYIKITDIVGNVVYETISNGSIAVWNGKNFDGQRPATGVYLIFLTNEDKTQTKVLKLLFIN